ITAGAARATAPAEGSGIASRPERAARRAIGAWIARAPVAGAFAAAISPSAAAHVGAEAEADAGCAAAATGVVARAGRAVRPGHAGGTGVAVRAVRAVRAVPGLHDAVREGDGGAVAAEEGVVRDARAHRVRGGDREPIDGGRNRDVPA